MRLPNKFCTLNWKEPDFLSACCTEGFVVLTSTKMWLELAFLREAKDFDRNLQKEVIINVSIIESK